MQKNTILSLVLFIALVLLLILYNFDDTQKSNSTQKIGVISLSKVDNATFNGFKQKMEMFGWIEGVNIKYIRPAPALTINNLENVVHTVLKKDVDLILVSSTPGTLAVKKLTKGKNIPVVFAPVNDPVGSGIIKDTRKHDGLITGIRLPIGDQKRFEWLSKIAPSVRTVLVPFTDNDKSSLKSRENIRALAQVLDIKLIEKTLNGSIQLFLNEINEDVDAIFLPRDSKVESNIDDFVKYANQKKLPLCAPSYQQVKSGALFAFGFIHKNIGSEAARLANNILRGVSPADLPVQTSKSHLVLNLKTAKQIGIEVPKDAIRSAYMIIK